ncbi:MAG: sensor histidine kinase [Longilinea sp.]|nr:sensor histidine kinase [Longilinea sp.]
MRNEEPVLSKWMVYSYLSVVMVLMLTLMGIALALDVPFWLAALLAILLGLGLFAPLIGRLVEISWSLAALRSGRLPDAPKRRGMLDPLFGLAQQVAGLRHLTEEVGQVRQGWLEQVTQAAAQQERNRLARELHDSIKQQLFSIQMSAAAAQERWQTDAAAAQTALADLRRSTQEALAEMNALLLQLSPAPLERVGLAQALQEQCEALGYRSGAQVQCRVGQLPADEALAPGWQEAVFRMAQEGLSNVARHARAGQVWLSLGLDEAGEALLLTIRDDGQGFDLRTARRGQGIASIQQRAADLGGQALLHSIIGQGTTLTVTLPVQSELQEGLAPVSSLPNRLALVGLLGGVLMAAAGAPVVLAQAGGYLSQARSLPWGWLVLVALLPGLAGWVAARWSQLGGRAAALIVGAVTGGLTAVTAFGLLLVTGAAMQGMDGILRYGLNPAEESLALRLFIEAFLGMFLWIHGTFWVGLLMGVGVGALGGLLAARTQDAGAGQDWQPLAEVLSLLVMAGAGGAYLFGVFVLPVTESAVRESALRAGVLQTFSAALTWLPIVTLGTPLFWLLAGLGVQYALLGAQLKRGDAPRLERAYWTSLQFAALMLGMALFGWLLMLMPLPEQPTTSIVFALGAGLILLALGGLFLRQSLRARRQLDALLQPRRSWMVTAVMVLLPLLPGLALGGLAELFPGWVFFVPLGVTLALALTLSVLPTQARPPLFMLALRQQVAQLSTSWLAGALALLLPLVAMGSSGLAMIVVLTRFPNALDAERLGDGVQVTLAELLHEGLLVRQPGAFALALVVALALVGTWLALNALRLVGQRKQSV